MNTNAFNAAAAIFERETAYISQVQSLRELELLVERLRFVPDLAEIAEHPDRRQLAASVSFLLQQGFSAPIRRFAEELIHEGIFTVLIGALGDVFCQHYRDIVKKTVEVRIIVPLELSMAVKEAIAAQIRQHSTQPVKVAFEVMPTIVGGCIIALPDGATRDLSLKTALTPLVRQFLDRVLRDKILPVEEVVRRL